MAFASVNDLVNLKKKDEFQPRINAGRYGAVSPGLINRKLASRILKESLQAALLGNQGNKANRPWLLVDVTEKLDPEQAWYGFEFEAGYASQKDYERVIKYFWSRFPYSSIDREGYGRYPAELTFSPCVEADLDNESCGMMKLAKYINRNKVGMAQWPAHSNTGTHVNISTPKFRALDEDTAGRVASSINSMLSNMTNSENHEFFGRNPYGHAYYQTDGKGKRWIEFKLFNSTVDEEVLRGYFKTAKRLAAAMDAIADNGHLDGEESFRQDAHRMFWRAMPKHRNSYMMYTPAYETSFADFLRSEDAALEPQGYVSIPEECYYNYSGYPSREEAMRMVIEGTAEKIEAFRAARRPAESTPQ